VVVPHLLLACRCGMMRDDTHPSTP